MSLRGLVLFSSLSQIAMSSARYFIASMQLVEVSPRNDKWWNLMTLSLTPHGFDPRPAEILIRCPALGQLSGQWLVKFPHKKKKLSDDALRRS